MKCVDLIQPCPFRIALSSSVLFLSNIEFQSLMVSDAFNSLTHRVLQRFTFLHQPIVLNILRPQLSTPQHQLRVFCLSCLKGGTCTSVQPYISGTGGQGTSSRILGSVVPIVSSSRENGNACQHSPEHGNKMYERGGTCTPVQPYISGTGGGAHPGES